MRMTLRCFIKTVFKFVHDAKQVSEVSSSELELYVTY